MCDAVCKNVAKPKMFINSEMSNSDHSLNHSILITMQTDFVIKKQKTTLPRFQEISWLLTVHTALLAQAKDGKVTSKGTIFTGCPGMLHEDLEKSSALLFAVHKQILHIDGMTLQTLENLVVFDIIIAWLFFSMKPRFLVVILGWLFVSVDNGDSFHKDYIFLQGHTLCVCKCPTCPSHILPQVS